MTRHDPGMSTEALFQLALDLDGAERRALLDRLEVEDAARHAEIVALMRHYDEAAGDGFLSGAAVDVAAFVGDLEPGDVIDQRYRIDALVGEGGMGTVYRAHQFVPVERVVALKQIKLGMDTKQVLARFDLERRTLAMMDHPSIARIHDAGVSASGRPYFVMEYVDGPRLTEYCDRHRLDVRRRLELFQTVCDAIHHAHQRGVIHRDIKPSNVLVVEGDHGPVPKIIDFGIAKATRDTDRSAPGLTTRGQLIGTPEYMSPEQAAGDDDAIDTRTDVYSLGVLLYELLAGSSPLRPETIRQAPLDEICRRIREEEAERPSTRVSQLDAARGATAAACRSATPASIVRAIRGDLDWIAMKAIEKDPERRYGSAAALADDVRRHLDDEPVLARAPATTYKIRKFVRRNRVGVIASAAVVLSLIAGLVASTTFAVGQYRAREAAAAETRTLGLASAFIRDLFSAIAPAVARGELRSINDILEEGARRVDTEYRREPLVQASIHEAIGGSYLAIGDYEPAERHLRHALDLFRAHRPPDHPSVLEAMSHLSLLLKNRGRLDEAEATAREAQALVRRRGGPTLDVDRRILNNLAIIVAAQGKTEEAARLYHATYEEALRVYGPTNRSTLISANNLGTWYLDRRQLDDAEPLLVDTYEKRRRTYGEDDPETLVSLANLALLREAQGDIAGATETLEALIERRRIALGENHPAVLASTNRLAMYYDGLGRSDEALDLVDESYAGAMQRLGAAHETTIETFGIRASILDTLGRHDEALEQMRECYTRSVEHLGANHPHTRRCIAGLAQLAEHMGRPDLAAEWQAMLTPSR